MKFSDNLPTMLAKIFLIALKLLHRCLKRSSWFDKKFDTVVARSGLVTVGLEETLVATLTFFVSSPVYGCDTRCVWRIGRRNRSIQAT